MPRNAVPWASTFAAAETSQYGRRQLGSARPERRRKVVEITLSGLDVFGSSHPRKRTSFEKSGEKGHLITLFPSPDFPSPERR